LSGRVLIVDDDPHFVRGLERLLRREGHDVSSALTATDARHHLRSFEPDVVVLDYQLPGKNGLELLAELRPEGRGAAFLMATAYPDVDVAVQAMREGAFHYIKKAADLSEYLLEIERGVRYAQARKLAAGADRGETRLQGLLGESAAMKSLWERVQAVSQSGDTTVLLLGETGTGKSAIAQAIHQLSPRAYEPFVALDCTAVPSGLFESELFGYEKGSFTGATGTKKGRVEAAQEGTLFLDEIGEIELQTQTKLLRLLEEREYTRVGSTRARRLEARVITATNRNLETAVTEGRFRADLRYRLEVFVVEVPPLREREDDIILLATSFAGERARALGWGRPELAPDVITALSEYPFPGNVRELRNMVEQAVLLGRGDRLTLEDFPVLDKLRRERGLRGSVRGINTDTALSLDRTTDLVPRLPPYLAPGSRDPSHVAAANDAEPVQGQTRAGTNNPRGQDAPPGSTPDPLRTSEGSAHPPNTTVPDGSARTSDDPGRTSDGAGRARTSDSAGGTVGDRVEREPSPARSNGMAFRPEFPDDESEGVGALGGTPSTGPLPGRTEARRRFEATERRRISEALMESGGNITAAARTLEMSRHQLLRRLKKYALD